MKSEIEIQKERIRELMNLIILNPELPIMPMVETEICADDSYSCWLGSWGNSRVDEYDELLTEQEAEELVKNYGWKKCIFINIDMPL